MRMYSLFTFERRHNLELSISKMVNECTVKYSSLDRLVDGGLPKGRKQFSEIRALVRQGRNNLLKIIENNVELPGT